MESQLVELLIECEDEEPLCIEAANALQEVLEEVMNALEGPVERVQLLYLRKGVWTKLTDNRVYQRLLRDARRAGQDEIALRCKAGGSTFSLLSESPSTGEPDWENISVISHSTVAETDRMTLTFSYLVLNGRSRDFKSVQLQSVDGTLMKLSELIIRQEGLPTRCCCAFYSSDGCPLTGSLIQMATTRCTEVMVNEDRVLALAVPYFDKPVHTALRPNQGASHIEVASSTDASVVHDIQVDLNSATVLELKRKVFALTNIPPHELVLHLGNQTLHDEARTLQNYSVKAESVLKYSQVPLEYGKESYKQFVKSLCEHSEKGRQIFHTLLHCFAKTAAKSTKPSLTTFLSIVRKATLNWTPLLHSLFELSQGKSMSVLDSIALEEGFAMLVGTIMHEVFGKTVPPSELLEHSIEVCAMLAEISHKKSPEECKEEVFVEHNVIDSFTCAIIQEPVRVQKLNGEVSFYERAALEERRHAQLAGLPPLSSMRFEVDTTYKTIIRRCDLSRKQSVFIWTGRYRPEPSFIHYLRNTFTQRLSWEHLPQLKQSYNLTKLVPALSLKESHYRNCMTLNKAKELRINLGLTQKMPNNVDLLNPLTGEKETVDVTDLASATQTTGQIEEFKEYITREPQEAIVVALDRSGSMGSKFESNSDFTRLAAVKQFFESFADRTVGYDYCHVMSLLMFSHTLERTCNFTENLSTFARKVQQTQSSGGTSLYDALSRAVDYLLEIKQTYPNCILRILCLSDGQDEHSELDSFDVCQKLLQNAIVLDSVVVGRLCDRLKAMTLATGGSIFLPDSVRAGIQLFESETLLSVARDEAADAVDGTTANSCVCAATSGKSAAGSSEPSDCEPLKRIFRELHSLKNNPHPSVSVYPAENDPNFWNVYFMGPEDTPYAEGVFHAYISFPDTYPVSAPDVRFITPIYHCNINKNGRICHSILGQFYRTDVTIREILDNLYGLLLTPEPTDPLDANIAAEYLDNLAGFREKARQFTRTHAKRSLAEFTVNAMDAAVPAYLCDPLTGALMEDPVLCIKSNRTYERQNIELIIQNTGKDPLTGSSITLQDLCPNIGVKEAIRAYKESQRNLWYLS